MAFKFIHMADIHLDTPFQSRDEGIRKLLKDSIKQAFSSSVGLAVSEGVHAVLIAGDLFDGDDLSFSTGKFLLQEMNRLDEAGIEVFYTPGNHDHCGGLLKHGIKSWPKNVHIFGSNNVESVEVHDRDGNKVGVVSGIGHENRVESRNLASMFPAAAHDVPHVGLLHALVTSSKTCESHGRYAPCSIGDLKDKGYSYWALGHIHAREEILDSPHIVYPGNLMGRNIGETGQKGVYLAEIGTSGSVKLKFMPVSPVVWENLIFDGLGDADNLHELEDMICASLIKAMEQENTGGHTFMPRVSLKGPCPIYCELSDDNIREITESIMSGLNLNFLEINADEFTRPIEIERYKGQPHMLSSALSIIDRLKEDDELLLKLSQGALAGVRMGSGQKEKIEYLRSLLDGLDYEAASRLLKEGTL